MATTNNPLTAAAKAIAAAQAKVASAQKVQRTATNSYKTSVNALATAQKAVKTLTSLKGGLTLKNAQTALAAAQRVVGAAQTIVKSTQMAVNTTTNTVKKLTGQTGSAGNPAIDNAIRQRVPYNAQTNTGTGPTMSSVQGLLNIPGATQIARNQADPEGNVDASRPQSYPTEFSSDHDLLGISSTDRQAASLQTASSGSGSVGHTVTGALGPPKEVMPVLSTAPTVEPGPPLAARGLTGPPITTQAERDAFVTHERAGVVYTGGTTQYVIAGAPKANAASDAVQPAINAKQAEIDQFNRDNPSSTTLRMEGKPMLTPEQDRERQRKVRELHAERRALVDKQNELKTPESTPPVVVSNTATNTSTTVDSKAAVRAEVDTGDGAALGLVDNSGPVATGPGTGTQVTRETTTVSGGGSTYVTAGIPKANAASDAVQPAIDAKQAEIDQFQKDNPSNFARKKQGLPPLSAEENQQRTAKLNTLLDEQSALGNKQNDLKTPDSTPPVVVPNTTTTTSTTVTSKAAALEPVDPEDDESLGQQVSEQSRFRVPEFGSGALTDIEQVDLTAAAAGGGSQRIDRQEDGPGTANTPVAPATAAAGSGSQRTDREEDGAVAPEPPPVISPAPVERDTTNNELGGVATGPSVNSTSVNGGAAIAGGGGSSTSTVSGTFKMGQPSGPITFNGQVVNPGDPDYPAASAALIESRDRLRNPVVKKAVAPATAAAGSGSQRTDREEDGAVAPEPPPVISPAPVERDTTNNELGGVVPDPTPVISPAPVERDTTNNELGGVVPGSGTTIDQDRLQGLQAKTALQPTLQARNKQPASVDWRVRLQLAPGAKYLYQHSSPGILAPLAATNGVIFPYTPTIETSYQANYDTYDLTHSNFRGYFYKGSKVNDINIRAIFTAQDTREAGYMLAVIHFFRSVTKMFYGAGDPLRGAPPPLTYLTGLGQYQFNQHPCVVQSFNYTLPSEVDYIRAEAPNNNGTNLGDRRVASGIPSDTRLAGTESKPPVGAQFEPGETSAAAAAALSQNVNNLLQATYVPTKIEISLVLLPINTRSQVSQQFNMQGFANGQLLKAGFW